VFPAGNDLVSLADLFAFVDRVPTLGKKMGAWMGRRAEPRVDFREDVRVIWPGEVSGVLARAVNLSPTGILVDAPTPTPCPVGSDVLCDVSLPRGPRLLRGRVAHRRLLPSAKVGMGIEFVDLSPREAAELRDVVGESTTRPQRVKVRFRGTEHVVTATASTNEDGFRLATALPFLKPDTEVDVALSPDETVSARGRVARVAFEPAAPGAAPRLLIDVRVDDPFGDSASARTPVVESLVEKLQAVPEYVWEPDELGVTSEAGPFGEAAHAEPPTPAIAALGAGEGAGAAAPVQIEFAEQTDIVDVRAPSSRWRALGGGMLAGLIAFTGFVVAIVLIKARSPAAPVISGSAMPVPQSAPTEAPLAPQAEPSPPPSAPEAARVPADDPGKLLIALTGSLAGSTQYPLRDPDGVAFNLPHARARKKLGTYTPSVAGLKSMWVRALPAGGTHLRFFYGAARPAPRIVLERDLEGDGVRVMARSGAR
jgi:hypothetical protein